MSIFALYLLFFIPSTYIGVLFLNVSQIVFVHRQPELFFSSIPLTLIISTAVLLVISIVVFANVKACDEAFRDMKRNDRNANLKEKIAILKTAKKLNKISVVGTVIGFVAGTIANYIFNLKTGILEFDLTRLIIFVIASIFYAFYEAMFMYNVINEMFKSFRKRLHITALAKEQKTLPISVSFSLLTVSAILFLAITIFAVGYGFVSEGNEELASSYIKGVLVAGGVGFGMCLSLIFFVLNGLKKRIISSIENITELGTGSLSNRIDIVVFDDFGILNSELNKLIKKLTDMLAGLRTEAQNVNNSANKLASISENADATLNSMKNSLYKIENESQKQADDITGAEKNVTELISSLKDVENHMVQSAESMHESTNSISQMTDNINSVADMTRKANELSEQLTTLVAMGNSSLQDAIKTVESINDAMNQVKEIVKMLQKVASQTNLLSMNASIEAAHAGSAGEGFAVVAGEVRELASTSGDSSQQIQDSIADMVNRVAESVAAIENTAQSFQQIKSLVEEHSQLVDSIAKAMTEQQASANANLSSTNAVYNDTNNVRDLVMSQNNLTLEVENTMTKAVASTQKMIEAVGKSNESSDVMQQVINQINAMIRENKEEVDRMNEQMNAFSL